MNEPPPKFATPSNAIPIDIPSVQKTATQQFSGSQPNSYKKANKEKKETWASSQDKYEQDFDFEMNLSKFDKKQIFMNIASEVNNN